MAYYGHWATLVKNIKIVFLPNLIECWRYIWRFGKTCFTKEQANCFKLVECIIWSDGESGRIGNKT
eukprot:2563856-Ditylum_brightwellii.AAC.1